MVSGFKARLSSRRVGSLGVMIFGGSWSVVDGSYQRTTPSSNELSFWSTHFHNILYYTQSYLHLLW